MAVQPSCRGNSWRLTIIEQRSRVEEHLIDSPSLKALLAEVCRTAYRCARLDAQKETGFAVGTFPVSCAWTFEQTMAEDLFPS